MPDARIAIGHGQMHKHELEKVMIDFVLGEVDILVCTTIIESGLDIPNANTIFINDADRFGLAELHQLRGRVGRYKHRAYAYLLLPAKRTITPTAAKRLKVIEEYSHLGAGFRIALRDLEIRGAGNLLGAEQHGQMSAVGFDMYCWLLSEAVQEAKGEEVVRAFVDRGLDAVILNPTAIIGPADPQPSRMGQVFLALQARKMPSLIEGGFDWVDVRDVVQAAQLAVVKGRTGHSRPEPVGASARDRPGSPPTPEQDATGGGHGRRVTRGTIALHRALLRAKFQLHRVDRWATMPCRFVSAQQAH